MSVIFLFTSTLMLLFFMWAKGELKMNRWLLSTTILCLLGLTLVVDIWNTEASHEIIGYILIMVGAVATATRLYMFGKFSKDKSPAVVGAETFIFAFLFLCLLPFYEMPVAPQSEEGWVWALLCAAALSFGSFSMFYAIAQIGPFYFSLYNKLEPVFTAIFSVLLIGEILSLSQYCGILIVIGSLVAYQLWDHRRKKKTALN